MVVTSHQLDLIRVLIAIAWATPLHFAMNVRTFARAFLRDLNLFSAMVVFRLIMQGNDWRRLMQTIGYFNPALLRMATIGIDAGNFFKTLPWPAWDLGQLADVLGSLTTRLLLMAPLLLHLYHSYRTALVASCRLLDSFLRTLSVIFLRRPPQVLRLRGDAVLVVLFIVIINRCQVLLLAFDLRQADIDLHIINATELRLLWVRHGRCLICRGVAQRACLHLPSLGRLALGLAAGSIDLCSGDRLKVSIRAGLLVRRFW